jgi:hypothetical protein
MLTPIQKAERVETARELKSAAVSQASKLALFPDGNESCLCYTISHDHMWLPDGAEAPIQLKQTIAIPKRMLTVFWFPPGFVGVRILPKGQHFDP